MLIHQLITPIFETNFLNTMKSIRISNTQQIQKCHHKLVPNKSDEIDLIDFALNFIVRTGEGTVCLWILKWMQKFYISIQ